MKSYKYFNFHKFLLNKNVLFYFAERRLVSKKSSRFNDTYSVAIKI